MHHFVAIGVFKLELESGNGQFEWNSTVFRAVWPWNSTDDLKNNRALIQCYFKLCASFLPIGEFKHELQSGNAQSGSNSTIFRAVWPWNLTDDLEKQYGTSSNQHQAICIISSSYVNSNRSYSPETVELGCDLCDLNLWPLTLTFCMDLTLVIGNNSWKFHDDTMMGTYSKRCDRQTDGQTENTICRAAWSQLKINHDNVVLFLNCARTRAPLHCENLHVSNYIKDSWSDSSHEWYINCGLVCHHLGTSIVLCFYLWQTLVSVTLLVYVGK